MTISVEYGAVKFLADLEFVTVRLKSAEIVGTDFLQEINVILSYVTKLRIYDVMFLPRNGTGPDRAAALSAGQS